MAPDKDNVINIGPATISVGGTDCGHTDENGIQVKVEQEIVRAFAAKYGKKSPVKTFINGTGAKITAKMIEAANWAAVAKLVPGATKVTSTTTKLTFGLTAGTEQTPAAIVISPMISGNTTPYAFSCYAVPVGTWTIFFDGAKYQVFDVEFEAVINEDGGADGSWLFQFGTLATTADAVAPTCSAISPADGATGVDPTAGGTITWTFSKTLDGNTVKANKSVLLMLNEGAGASALIALTGVVLTNNGASTTIVATYPTLSGSTKYNAVITAEVTSTAGVAFGGSVSDFTTA